MRNLTRFGLLLTHAGVAPFAIIGSGVLPQCLAAQSGGSGITTEPVSLPDTAPDQSRLAPQQAPPSDAIIEGTFIGAVLGGGRIKGCVKREATYLSVGFHSTSPGWRPGKGDVASW